MMDKRRFYAIAPHTAAHAHDAGQVAVLLYRRESGGGEQCAHGIRLIKAVFQPELALRG